MLKKLENADNAKNATASRYMYRFDATRNRYTEKAIPATVSAENSTTVSMRSVKPSPKNFLFMRSIRNPLISCI